MSSRSVRAAAAAAAGSAFLYAAYRWSRRREEVDALTAMMREAHRSAHAADTADTGGDIDVEAALAEIRRRDARRRAAGKDAGDAGKEGQG